MTKLLPSRRGFITGLISLVAAPAIVRAGSLMPVKVMPPDYGIGPAMRALELLHAERMVNPPFVMSDWIVTQIYVDGDVIKFRGIDHSQMWLRR